MQTAEGQKAEEVDELVTKVKAGRSPGQSVHHIFADPSRPDQKGGCEKNHVELRKILPKGTSFDGLDPSTLAEICSHMNSSVRKGCGDVSPMQLAQLVFPKAILDNLGLKTHPTKRSRLSPRHSA